MHHIHMAAPHRIWHSLSKRSSFASGNGSQKIEVYQCLTMRSKRSLRSLGPAKAGPLA